MLPKESKICVEHMQRRFNRGIVGVIAAFLQEGKQIIGMQLIFKTVTHTHTHTHTHFLKIKENLNVHIKAPIIDLKNFTQKD